MYISKLIRLNLYFNQLYHPVWDNSYILRPERYATVLLEPPVSFTAEPLAHGLLSRYVLFLSQRYDLQPVVCYF